MLRRVCGQLFRQSLSVNTIGTRCMSNDFQGRVSQDNQNSDIKVQHEVREPDFTGIIPTDKLQIQYCRSGGPGGQHVNKVNTKVEVRFNINTAEWIPDWIKPILKEQQPNRINKDGEFIVKSEKTRKQILNQADCLDKIRHMIFTAQIKPKEITPEMKAKQKAKEEKANLKRLEEKRRRSMLKSMRRSAP